LQRRMLPPSNKEKTLVEDYFYHHRSCSGSHRNGKADLYI